MTITHLDTLPFPCHVQLCDGASVGRSRYSTTDGSTNGITGGGSRYAPFWERVATNSRRPALSTVSGQVGTWARFYVADGTVARSNFWYRLAGSKIDGKYGTGEDDIIDELPSSWAAEFVFYLDFGSASAALDLFQFQLDSGDNDGDEQWWLIRQTTATNTALRKRDYQAGTDGNTNFSSAFATGNVYSMRVIYSASTGTGNDDGTIQIAIANSDCIDDDAKGNTTSWSQVINISNHDAGKLLRVAMGWENANATHAQAGHGNYIKGFCLLASAPTSLTTGTSSWFRLHRMNYEKGMLWWDGTQWQLRASMVHHHGLLGEGDIKTQQRLRYFTSLANLNSGTAADTGSFQTVADDGNGYYRTLDTVDLPADSECWVEVQNFNDDSGGDWFVRGTGGEYAHFRTPPAPEGTQTKPIRIHLRGCENSAKAGPTSRAQTADYCDATAQTDIVFDLGDNIGGNYMDEESWDVSGTEYEGAQTDQHMADAHATIAHSWHRLREAALTTEELVLSDHDGAVNDARQAELWADGTTAQWGKGGANDPIDNTISTEYQITPRSLMDLLETHHVNRVYDAMVLSTQSSTLKAWRHFPTGNKYGATAYNANGRGYYRKSYGKHTFIFLPLRDYANFHTGGTNILWGDAQTDIEAWIAAIDQPGTTLWLVSSEWLTGFDETDGTIKNNDNPSSMRQDADVTAELTAVAKTAINSNSNIAQCHILTYDHHFEALLLTADNTDTAISSKIKSQISCGGVSGLGQNFETGLGSGVTLDFATRHSFAQGDPVRSLAYIDIPVSGAPTLTVREITGTTTSSDYTSVTLPSAASIADLGGGGGAWFGRPGDQKYRRIWWDQ